MNRWVVVLKVSLKQRPRTVVSSVQVAPDLILAAGAAAEAIHADCHSEFGCFNH